MGVTDRILEDHKARRDHGISWFTASDMVRLGIHDPLFSVMQTVQHSLRSRRLPFSVESRGQVDRWSVEDTHKVHEEAEA